MTQQKSAIEEKPSRAQSNLSKLPPYCFGVLLSDKSIIRIVAGESGYYKVELPRTLFRSGETADQLADRLNANIRITRQQREAMQSGSMFGWGAPAANPDIYNEDGTVNKTALAAQRKGGE